MKYVAFLRGINVGGHTIIKMADLKQIFESLRLADVQTYIQSGNVIFQSDEKAADILAAQIERQLEKATGYRIQLFVRTMREVRNIAANSPFTPEDDETVHVTFLKKKPGSKAQQALLAYKSDADDFAFKGRELYNLRRDRQRSIFSNNWVETILTSRATTRNLTTIKKIAEKYQ
jgi:uncharacterized protein (DUF1697 family)